MGFNVLGTTSSSVVNFFSHTPSYATSAAAIYFASVVNVATTLYLELLQLTAIPFKINMYPD
jgi:hypothetical protein